MTGRTVDITTVAGQPIRLRMATPDDRDVLIAGFEHLGSSARYYRFFTGMPRLSDSTLELLTSMDPRHHLAIAAFDPTQPSDVDDNEDGRGIGVGRLVRITRTPGRAELTVTVIDDHRRLGVGILLMEALFVVATHWDVDTLLAVALTENRAMVGLAHRFGGTLAPSGNEDAAVRTYEIPVERGLAMVSSEHCELLGSLYP